MRVLVDAHLLKRLSEFLLAHEIESKHTLDLPRMNATPDTEIIRFAGGEDRIVISKDSDFLDNYILDESPKKLLTVSTGNINNRDLIRLFEKNLETLKSLFDEKIQ
ncbi:DUF5615 family PIN-like protein [Rhodohalobacter sp.]|uniref:DUF5615 family PIN-like protein n=1 Tax=Rhodohalobacter sp. TaxID=1974210 RepID=UPI002ACE6D48|nr:DUF5615 family PIN-like protein [Rhodohalobacter sp.]MDZ7754860.1 DUF5615 family PIN-like protein [Rhodohalobacter sp.]